MKIEPENTKCVIAILICLMLIGTIIGCIIISSDNEKILYDQKDSMKMNNKPLTSCMSDSKTLVLQIAPELECGQIQINGKITQKIAAHIIIPNSDNTITCPLNYFQENASLSRKYINTDSGDKYNLEHIDELRSVVITVINQGEEVMCKLPDDYGIRLLPHNI